MAVRLLARVAAADDVPVFAAVGQGVRGAVDDLFLLPGVRRVATPRAATVLLVAGELRPRDEHALRRVHDQLPHPRATVWWRGTPPGSLASMNAQRIEASDAQELVRVLRAHHARLLRDPGDTEPDWLPDEPPAAWRGKGENGQGGEGMMGGVPYGRPMAMTAEDLRDGLQLDAFSLRLGPFAPMLPPGMELELTLQGDVIQHAKLRQPAFQAPADDVGTALRCAARMLDLLELPSLARRCRRMARDGIAAPRIARRVRWSGALAAVPAGLGYVEALGSDAQDRLRAWTAGVAATPAAIELHMHELLPGLEWQEAMLVIASLDGGRFAMPQPGGADDPGAHSMQDDMRGMHSMHEVDRGQVAHGQHEGSRPAGGTGGAA